MTRAKTRPLWAQFPHVQTEALRGTAASAHPAQTLRPGWICGELSAGRRARAVRRTDQRVHRDPPGPRRAPPTPLPQQAASTGSRPVIPTPRATLLGREAPGLSLRAHLPGDQILLRRRLCVHKRPGHGPAPGIATAPAQGAPRTMDGRDPPRTALIGYLERPLKLCFPIGRYGVQPAAGRRLGRRHCGKRSPSTQTTQAAGLGEAFGVENLGRCSRARGRKSAGWPSGLQCWPEL